MYQKKPLYLDEQTPSKGEKSKDIPKKGVKQRKFLTASRTILRSVRNRSHERPSLTSLSSTPLKLESETVSKTKIKRKKDPFSQTEMTTIEMDDEDGILGNLLGETNEMYNIQTARENDSSSDDWVIKTREGMLAELRINFGGEEKTVTKAESLEKEKEKGDNTKRKEKKRGKKKQKDIKEN